MKVLIGFFLIILSLGMVFEVVIIGIAFFGADEVNCNLLWCEFKTTNKYVNDSVVIRANQRCFFNNKEVDCNNNFSVPVVDTSGNFDNWDIEWIER